MWSEWLETTLQRAAEAEGPDLRDSLRRVQFLLIHDIIDDGVAEEPALLARAETADETVD